jgi:hypothetical protein
MTLADLPPATGWPPLISQVRIVPSSIESDRRGMVMSVMGQIARSRAAPMIVSVSMPKWR